MIESYGLHWHIDKVFWGRQNNAGSLRGAASRSPSAVPVEFRDQRGIYALYADYELVYVGQTGAGDDRLFKRLKTHKTDHLAERWNRFSWFGTQWVTQQHKLSVDTAKLSATVESALNIMEAVAIAISEPHLNLQRGRWGDSKQYYQVRPDEDAD
ncbi:GIY-YIG nuclease family protein [Hyphomicrobium sp. B1]|uniref:GIY-YIG nuclease family protein n=1 Tax=Hyphomicrobium sp. B1 TaxID=3075651 RepID=UPI003C2E64EF